MDQSKYIINKINEYNINEEKDWKMILNVLKYLNKTKNYFLNSTTKKTLLLISNP